MLELKGICKTFNPNTINAKVALNHLNLTLNDGDFVTVIAATAQASPPCSTPLPACFRWTKAPSPLTDRTLPSCRSISGRRFWAACFRIP